MIHELKTDPQMFAHVWNGDKKFEIRYNDRCYQVGDVLVLKDTVYTGEEMEAGKPLKYTGYEVRVRVIYILRGPIYGLQKDWVIMGIEKYSIGEIKEGEGWMSDCIYKQEIERLNRENERLKDILENLETYCRDSKNPVLNHYRILEMIRENTSSINKTFTVEE